VYRVLEAFSLNATLIFTLIIIIIIIISVPLHCGSLKAKGASHFSNESVVFADCYKEFELLCKNYSVTQPQAHGRFRACVWQAFVCHLAGF